MAVTRGCGTRVSGGVYLTVATSPHGQPIEYFICDPPIPVSKDAFGLSEIGVTLIEREDGIAHIFDIVGREGYPNVADFVEEARRFGISRRIARNSDFAKLSVGSRLVLLHSHAMITNADAYQRDREAWQLNTSTGETMQRFCPKRLPEHQAESYTEMCAGLWWEDIVEGELSRIAQDPIAPAFRGVDRKMPSFSYSGWRAPSNVRPEYQLAIFASFPIGGIEVVRDREGGSHERGLENASKSGLPVQLTEE